MIYYKISDVLFSKKNMWSDEAKFANKGMFNRDNSYYWSHKNYHVIWENYFQNYWRFNVYCAVKYDTILVIWIYNEKLSCERYFNLLQEAVVPAIHVLSDD